MYRTEKLTIRTDSESDTEQFGVGVGRRIDRAVRICLVGSLGTGKSVLARAIARGLDVREVVISPTFILFEEYPGRLPVIHCDLYRLEHEREIEELGLFERVAEEAVALIEWGDRSPGLFSSCDIAIDLSVTGPTSRRIDIHMAPDYVAWFEACKP